MESRLDRRRSRVGLGVTLLVGVVGVAVGLWAHDLATVIAAVGFVALMWLVTGPLLRWLRRGEGPHATSGEGDRRRTDYLRIRYPGDHQGG